MADREEQRPKRRRERAPVPRTHDPIEIAMALPGTAGVADALLRRQAVLVDEQIGLARHQRLHNRFKTAREVSLALLVLLLLVGAALFVQSARNSRGLVISALSVPPDFEQRGLSGGAVASQLLDRLNAMQEKTDSARASSTYENNWEGDVDVEIPQTGVSAGELHRWLRRRLGAETRINGEIFRIGDKLSLAIRTGASGTTFSGTESELNLMLQQAAEAIYRDTQPYRHAMYISDTGRKAEAIIALQRLAKTGSDVDRAWALLAWGIQHAYLTGDADFLIARQHDAINVKPDLAIAHDNIGQYSDMLGRSEAGYLFNRSALRLYEGPAGRELDPNAKTISAASSRGGIAASEGDFRAAADHFAGTTGIREYSGGIETAPFRAAEMLALGHDVEGARRMLSRAGTADAGEIQTVASRNNIVLVPTLALATERGDWARVVAEGEAANRIARRSPLSNTYRRTSIWPMVAHARARLGDFSRAAAIIGATPLDCVPCVRVRAQIAALQGNRPEAERWFARAVQLAPSLPFAYAQHGNAALTWGDTNTALRLAEEAQRRAPQWADPLKLEADALTRAGQLEEADRSYREAAKRSPRWGSLQLDWATALWRLGRREAAVAKLRSAVSMDLNSADRLRLARMLEGAGRLR